MSFRCSFVASGNELSGSSYNDRIQGSHLLNFPDGEYQPDSQPGYINWSSSPSGSTAEWYRNQPTTTFRCIQHRKERVGPFLHEFIVVELDNDTVCRFDRRGDPTTRANAFTTEGMTAEDTAHVIHKHEAHYAEIHKTSDLLLQINLPDSEDLYIILCICRGIRECQTTRSYSLLEHNCYFFSWMILATVVDITMRIATHTLRHRLSSSTLTRIKNQISTLGSRIMAKASAASKASMTGTPEQISGLVLTVRDLRDGKKEAIDVYSYIASRIHDHCKNLRTFGVFLSPMKFEGAMWDCYIAAWDDDRNCKFGWAHVIFDYGADDSRSEKPSIAVGDIMPGAPHMHTLDETWHPRLAIRNDRYY